MCEFFGRSNGGGQGVRERLAERYPDAELLFADGFDDAIAGVVTRYGQVPIVAYCRKRCLEILVASGATPEEAVEYFDFNVTGAWVGENTPCFLEHL